MNKAWTYKRFEYLEIIDDLHGNFRQAAWNHEIDELNEQQLVSYKSISHILSLHSRIGWRLCVVIPGEYGTRYCFQRKIG